MIGRGVVMLLDLSLSTLFGNKIFLMVLFWFAAPFFLYGLIKGFALIDELRLVRRGYFKAYFTLPNNRRLMQWIKISTDSFKIKEDTYSFSDKPGYVLYEGRTPTIAYDAKRAQINFSHVGGVPDDRNMDTLLIRVFNEGKIQGFTNYKYILYGVIGACVIGAVACILSFSVLQQHDTLLTAIKSMGVIK